MKQQSSWIYPDKTDISPDILNTAGSGIIARLLLNRGIDTPKKIKAFLNPSSIELCSPYVFTDMEKAVKKINELIENQQKIVIYGDFDADGITSTSLFYKTLVHLRANVEYYIPDRSKEGHGLNSAAICKLISSKKAKLIITCDCGVSNIAEINLAKSFGADVIVTDHHEPLEDLPPAYAIINPKVSQKVEHTESIEYLAGVGVAYKVSEALLESNNKSEFAKEIIHLAAIGTIADVVPLVYENRAIVNKGLESISTVRPKGLIKLFETAGVNIESGISSDNIAFGIAPRINAVGRLDSASIAVEMLTSQDDSAIDTLAKKLDHNNRLRQQICENTYVEAVKKVETEIDFNVQSGIVLADAGWHPGIIGIVASKLVEKYHRPVFMMAIDQESMLLRCSARSVEGFVLHEFLNLHENIFEHFGGHSMAAGFSIDLNKMKLEDFVKIFNTSINQNFSKVSLQQKIHIDADISYDDIDLDFMEDLNRLAPFGEGNPAPLFSISGLDLKQYKTIGASKNHLKVFLGDQDNIIDAVWWQKDDLDMEPGDKVNVAFSPKINSYAGKTNIQLELKDIKLANGQKTKSVELQKTPGMLKWVDHRKKTDIAKVIRNYVKNAPNSVGIYSENPQTLEKIKQISAYEGKIFDRINMPVIDELMLFDIPTSAAEFNLIVENSNAQVVHIMPSFISSEEPKNILKKLFGMLKYAYSNRNGTVNINELASKIYTSLEVVKSCMQLLDSANYIEIEDFSDVKMKFSIGSSPNTNLAGFEEYDIFIDQHKKSCEFIEKFSKAKAEQISALKTRQTAVVSENI